MMRSEPEGEGENAAGRASSIGCVEERDRFEKKKEKGREKGKRRITCTSRKRATDKQLSHEKKRNSGVKRSKAFCMGALAFELLDPRRLTKKILVTRSDLQFQQKCRGEHNGENFDKNTG